MEDNIPVNQQRHFIVRLGRSGRTTIAHGGKSFFDIQLSITASCPHLGLSRT